MTEPNQRYDIHQFDTVDMLYELVQRHSRVCELLCRALETSGAHHKQWYLFQIAQTLRVDLSSLGDIEDIDEGIAP